MANIQHRDIPDAQRHEPKGASTAAAGTVYVSNGAGSGSWTNIESILKGSGSWSTVFTAGWEDQQDTTTTGTPISIPGTLVYQYLTNDGAGGYTNESYILPGRTSAWNVSSNQFEWGTSGMVLGDTCTIRADIYVTTTGANQNVDLDLEMGIGSGSSYDLEFIHQQYKTAGVQHLVATLPFYIGNTATLNYPAKMKLKSDAAATVVVNGWYLETTPLNPVFA